MPAAVSRPERAKLSCALISPAHIYGDSSREKERKGKEPIRLLCPPFGLEPCVLSVAIIAIASVEECRQTDRHGGKTQLKVDGLEIRRLVNENQGQHYE